MYSNSDYSGGGRSRRATNHHDGLKTSLQVIGLLICLKLLLPKMFPLEQDRMHEREREYNFGQPRYQSEGREGPNDNSSPPPPYSRAALTGPSELRQITYTPASPSSSSSSLPPPPPGASSNSRHAKKTSRAAGRDRDASTSEWDGTTVHGSDDSGSENERERRERRERRRARRKVLESERDRERGRRRRGH